MKSSIGDTVWVVPGGGMEENGATIVALGNGGLDLDGVGDDGDNDDEATEDDLFEL